MVEDNYKLIHGVMRDFNLDDEWSGLLAIELCKAVIKFNPDRGKLSTYYYERCKSLINVERRKANSQKRSNNGILQLNEELVDGDSMEVLVEENILLEQIINSNPRYKEIIRLRYQGYNQTEIAEKMKMTQSQISRILSDIRQEYEKNNKED